MATEVSRTGEPCTPSHSFVDGITCSDEPTERMSLAALDPVPGDGAFASGPPPAAPDSGTPPAFRHPFFIS